MAKPLDPLELLRTARAASQQVQELITKSTMPPAQRRALVEGVSRMVLPGEQLQAMIDLADAFGPPKTQIAEIQKVLIEQRAQLETMLAELDKIETSVDRLAESSEQIAALQAPLRAMLERRQGGSVDTEDE